MYSGGKHHTDKSALCLKITSKYFTYTFNIMPNVGILYCNINRCKIEAQYTSYSLLQLHRSLSNMCSVYSETL